MPDPHTLAFLRIPYPVLIALSSREVQFLLQPWHYLIRIAHILSMAAFFGAIGLLDLRLMGIRGTVPLRPFADHTLPWLYGTFTLACVTGILLFFYDPVHVGSHAYFTPKLILVVAGLANAAIYHRTGYIAALAAEHRMPTAARVGGAISIALWTGVVICACLNTEAAPKVLLR